ncbi:MAG: hypothetical protein ACE5HK_00415 [Candidatus Methylomirabilales bacterium]
MRQAIGVIGIALLVSGIGWPAAAWANHLSRQIERIETRIDTLRMKAYALVTGNIMMGAMDVKNRDRLGKTQAKLEKLHAERGDLVRRQDREHSAGR